MNSGDDAPGDGGMQGDGGGDGGDNTDGGHTDAPPMTTTCGTSTCRTDETCVQGTCKASPCVGYNVPGDYANLQTAVTALAATGLDATICLGTRTYAATSTINLDDAGAHGKHLQLVGEGMDRTIIDGRLFLGGGWSKITIRGVTLFSNTTTEVLSTTRSVNPDLELLASRVAAFNGIEAYQRQNVLIDGCVIDTTNYGISLLSNTSGPMAVRIQNTVFTGDGVSLRAQGTSTTLAVTLAVRGATFHDFDKGIELAGNVTASITSSIFTGADGHALSWTAGDTVTHSHNALWGNDANYSGLAADGPGYVKADCLLTDASPAPGLGAGSPCRDAGDPATATARDFYGVLRTSPPDIGAAEAP